MLKEQTVMLAVEIYKNGGIKADVARMISERERLSETQSKKYASEIWEEEIGSVYVPSYKRSDFDWKSLANAHPNITSDSSSPKVSGEYNKVQDKDAESEGNQSKLSSENTHPNNLPWRSPVENPPNWTVSKTTVQYDKDGNVIQEWRRLFPEAQSLLDFVELLEKRVEGKAAPVLIKPPPSRTELLHEIFVTDAHLGLLAEKDTTGSSDYDTKIAKNLIVDAVANLASRCKAEEILLVFGGDNLHADNRSKVTEKSGHMLDVDTRYQRTVEFLEDSIINSIDICRNLCSKVNVLIVPGNHDWHTSVCMSRIIKAYYRNTEEVDVLINHKPRHAYVWGLNLICHAHGDNVNPSNWSKIIPAEFKRAWADTDYRYLHLGHIHKSKTFEPIRVDSQVGLVIEYVRSLCPQDRWSSDMGYVGNVKGAESFVYHRQNGLEARYSYNSKLGL